MYPVILDPNFLLDDDRFVWAKRREVKGEKKNQVIALMKGGVPEKVFISGIGYRKVAKSIEQSVLCYKCSKGGHMTWKCQSDFRCRYCGGKHNSLECGGKIKNGQCVTPRFCNCSGEHNANSVLCEKRPLLRTVQLQGAGEEQPIQRKDLRPVEEPPPPPENAWKKRMERNDEYKQNCIGSYTEDTGKC